MNLLAIVVLISVISVYNLALNHVKKERDSALEKVGALSAEITAQNASVNLWKKEADMHSAKVAELQNRATISFVAAEKQIDSISINSNASCEDSINWAIKQAQDLNK